MLHDCSVGDAHTGDEESYGDPSDRTELDAKFAKEWVDNSVQQRYGDDDGDGVEVLHQVVGNSMTRHLFGLRHKVA